MSTRSVTVEISAEVYDELSRRAAHSSRSVADELVRAAENYVASDQLPTDLEEELAALPRADDGALRSAALSHLSEQERDRLEELHDLKGARGLSPEEEAEASELLRNTIAALCCGPMPWLCSRSAATT